MRIYPVILLAAALGFLIGGVPLMVLGGSYFYVFSGVLLAAVSLLLWRGSRWGLWVYGTLFGATILWALWEAGLDAWALLPRLWLIAALGAWLLLPRARRGLRRGPASSRAARAAPVLLAGFVVLAFAAVFGRNPGAAQPRVESAPTTAGDATGSRVAEAGEGAGGGDAADVEGAADGEWTNYGGASGGTRFSRMRQITSANVGKLTVAWRYDTGEAHPDGLEVTPIQVGDSVYLCTAANLVVALDAESGVERWRHDPKPRRNILPGVCRGVAYYRVPNAAGECSERIFTNTFDARLIALDAHSGRRCSGFGHEGEVSLQEGMRPVGPGQYMISSAPTIARGRLVIGGIALAVKGFYEPSGVIRAFDAVTGKLSWAYDAGHPDRAGTPPAGDFYTVGMPNAWAPMSYDDALGLVYVPTATGGAAYYGAARRAVDEEISTSLLALDVETGRRRWLYQMVHHDLWDYDIPSQPILADLQLDGRTQKALVQPTKMGETFVLDRTTGVPIDPVVERSVSRSGGVPEEHFSATQPVPTQMPSLSGGMLTEQQMWGLTPFDQLWCRIKFREARYDGIMTPPGLSPSIQYPGWLGGMDWGGASVDLDRGVMVAVTNYVANYVRMTRLDQGLRKKVDKSDLAAFAMQSDVPYTNSTLPFLSPFHVPCQQPPWSRLTAIDIVHHRILWSHPLGTGKDNGPFGIATHLSVPIGVPALGNVLVTRGGLAFVAASTDRTLRAFDTATGRLLWEAGLPASGNAGPITYRSPLGRQVVLVPAGGHKILGGPRADVLIAYALPRGS